MVRVWYCIRK